MPTVSEPASRKSVTLPESMWAAIGEYRFYNRIPTEAEAIRQLIQRGLDLPRHLEPWQATVEILAGRKKHYPGQFDAAGTDAFAISHLLAREIQTIEPSLRNDQVAAKAEDIVRNALQEAGGDIHRARSLLNVNWRRFA